MEVEGKRPVGMPRSPIVAALCYVSSDPMYCTYWCDVSSHRINATSKSLRILNDICDSFLLVLVLVLLVLFLFFLLLLFFFFFLLLLFFFFCLGQYPTQLSRCFQLSHLIMFSYSVLRSSPVSVTLVSPPSWLFVDTVTGLPAACARSSSTSAAQ